MKTIWNPLYLIKPKEVYINEEDSRNEIMVDQLLEFDRDQERFLGK